MDENPKEAGAASDQVYGLKGGTREDLRRVAKYQKGLLVCILIQVISSAAYFALPREMRPFLGLGVAPFWIAGTVLLFLLALKVYNIWLGIFLGILSLIPLVGFIALFVVNGKATEVLRGNRVKVGFMGAKLSKI